MGVSPSLVTLKNGDWRRKTSWRSGTTQLTYSARVAGMERYPGVSVQAGVSTGLEELSEVQTDGSIRYRGTTKRQGWKSG